MSEKTEKKDKKEKGHLDVVDNLFGGHGLIQVLMESLDHLVDAVKSGKANKSTDLELNAPISLIEDKDLDDSDPVVQEFLGDEGCGGVVKIMRFTTPEEGEAAVEKLASLVNKLNGVRMANRRDLLRKIFAAIQTVRGVDNEAVRLERLASRMDNSASRGFYQAEAVAAIDALMADTPDANERRALNAAREGVLQGEDTTLDAAAFRLRSLFANTLLAEKNVRVAYTTLRTQDGEPYLLCPKGKHVMGYPVPMEVSKCRENCIDSRMASDGSVSCQYQTWLKTADSHEKAMGRLDVHRHPDNEMNLLTLAAGERAKPLKDSDIPLEKRFEDSTQGVNKLRDKNPSDVSLESQLEKAKAGQPGYRGDNATPLSEINAKVASFNFRRRVNAQLASDKTLEEQMPKGHTNGTKVLEEQIREQANNNIHEMHEMVREQQLDATTSLNGHRGEMEKSYAHQLAEGDSAPESVSESFNKQEEIGGVRVTEKLTPTASKVIELDADSDESLGAQIEEKHSDTSYGDEAIEAMLEDERVGLSEDEIDMLLEELLEKSRTN